MKTEEKNKKYEVHPQKPETVEEQVALYGVWEPDVTKRYSYADYLKWLDDKRRELINGFIHLMSAPLRRHAHVSSELSTLYKGFVRANKGSCHVYHAPFDVRLPLHGSNEDNQVFDVVQPDVCIICDLSKLDDRGCIGAPDLVAEVLSPSTLKYDWNYKFNLYEAAGVREYWIVDPIAKAVHVFILQPDGKYDMGTSYQSTQKVPVFVLKGLEIELAELFE